MNPYGQHHHHHGQPATFPESFPAAQGNVVKIYCEANPDLCLAHRNGSVAMIPANESDPNQQWIMDTTSGVKAKDSAGFPAFALVNKATGQSLRHGRAELEKVILGVYHADDLNEAVLFTQSADVGKGYQCIRPVNDISLNLDADIHVQDHEKKHHHDKNGVVEEGARIVLTKWAKKETQKWKVTPILGASQASASAEHSRSLYPEVNRFPEGVTVRIHCEANPGFFMAARGHVPVLAVANAYDPAQQWVKVDSWGLKIKDEVGYPSFALVNKASGLALKHGDKEWDQILLKEYSHEKPDHSILWTLSADVGDGYQCLRPVNNIHLNVDAKQADSHNGGIHDGNELILFEWKKQSNQKWKLLPIH